VEKLQRCLGRILFHSTFGVVLLTTASMLLILWFFLMGTHPTMDVVAESADDLSAPSATAGVRVNPSDRYAANRGASAPRVALRYVARLTRTCDCRWAKNTVPLRDGTPLRVGQTLHVAAGLAEIAFDCGAKAILEGPVELELQSEKSIALYAGRLTADVPDDLEGFKIRTPVAEVVSLPSDPEATEGKTAPKAKPSAAKREANTGWVVLKAGEHARIEVPARRPAEKP